VTDTVLEKSDLHLTQDEHEKESKIVAGNMQWKRLISCSPRDEDDDNDDNDDDNDDDDDDDRQRETLHRGFRSTAGAGVGSHTPVHNV
jgi:hypothetical protein